MKLLKLSEEHYIIADKVDIKVGDWITDKYSVWQWKDDSSLLGRLKVTHSTEPLEEDITYRGIVKKPVLVYWSINQLTVSEVKKLLGGVDVKKKAHLAAQKRYQLERIPLEQINEYGGEVKEFVRNFIVTYNQALEDNKEKKYTEEDMRKALSQAFMASQEGYQISSDKIIQSFQPATEWEVDYVDGKLKLK